MKKIYSLLFLSTILLSTFNLSASTVYVDAAATGANNGTSWTDAYHQLSDALAFATVNPAIDTILVAAGVYYPTGSQSGTNRDSTFVIPQNGKINIYGGYPVGGDTRDIDANPLNIRSYYRLQMVDLDGTFSYSRQVTAEAEKGSHASLYSNPTFDNIYVRIDANDVKAQLVDMTGKTIVNFRLKSGENKINVSGLVSGMYTVVITGLGGRVETLRFVK